MVDLQRSRQKSKKACSSKVSNPVWQHQVTKIFWTKLSYKGVLVKTVSERCPLLEVTSQLTTGTLTHDFHEVKCFWNTGWLEIPLKEDLPFPLASQETRPSKAISSSAGSLDHSAFLLTGTCWTCGAATVWTVAGVNVWMVPLAACVSTRWACTVCTCCWMVTGWTWEDVTRLWTWGWRTEKQKRCQE